MTNIELVTDMMSFSKAGALKQAFIVEAIRNYAEQTLAAEPWASASFISQEAWKQCAKECLFTINHREHIETIHQAAVTSNL